MLNPSAHTDSYSRDNLPPQDQWPELLLDGFSYPDRINVGHELTDAMVEKGFGDKVALIGNGRTRTYKELTIWTNQLAHVLVNDLGIQPGNRVLIRSANNPAMVACWLAATKVGAVVINTMPMLRAGELEKIVCKAEVSHALCDSRLMEEMELCAAQSPSLKSVTGFDGGKTHNARLDQLSLQKPTSFETIPTSSDDVALLGFTSGSTGDPKATMHFHRDLLIIADAYAKEILQVTPNDVFAGSPPLAFTFGLGGLAVFPLRFGATAVLLEEATPPTMMNIIKEHRVSVCFTVPTAYQVMLNSTEEDIDLSSLRVAVSAGETLPAPIYKQWIEKTGTPILDGIGATEMLHVFISNGFENSRPGTTGKLVSGYQARIVDEHMRDVADGEAGYLAIRGPTGCRYLNDTRQLDYVCDGWNITGDSFCKDDKGFFHFIARNDDIIVSAGYNIAGPEVEAALLLHQAVSECAVIAASDTERGHIVEAHVVLKEGMTGNDSLKKQLQDHVKATIAPYKYPRSIRFTSDLPKTPTGKIQRFLLRQAR